MAFLDMAKWVGRVNWVGGSIGLRVRFTDIFQTSFLFFYFFYFLFLVTKTNQGQPI